ncbi:MAG: hypothetical protein R6X18_11110 [Chloroflexota bacterium]|jgi:hypothetical protein
MKARKLFLLFVCVLAVMLLVTGLAAAKATRTEFTGTETQIGGEAPLRYWEAGQTAHIRGMQGVYWEEATDPRVSGINTILVNMNIHPVSGGGVQIQFWGTYVLENEGGSWSGTFQGLVAADGIVTYDAHGEGSGSYQGLKIFLHAENTTFSGYILDPGK